MANNGIEDILIGESYKSTKKKSKLPIIFIILLMIAGLGAGWYFYKNREVTDAKTLFSKSFLSLNSKKLSDSDFYSTILDRLLQENSEMTSNITVSTTEKVEALNGIDVNNFDFELTSQNDLKGKNFYGELLLNYSGNYFLKFQGIVNDNKFAIISDEIVNRYVGVKAENFNDIFDSSLDLNFIYEFVNADKITLTTEEKEEYLTDYYKKIYNQIPLEKFTQKDNIVITKNDDYVDVTAYELSLNQSELNDIIVNILTEIKSDEKLLNSIVAQGSVELDLSSIEETSDEDGLSNSEGEIVEDELEVRDENTVMLQLVPVTEQNFQTAEIIDEEQEQMEDENFEVEEEYEQSAPEEINSEGLIMEVEQPEREREFTTSDLIKILLGRKVNISKDKIVEKIDKYIEELDGYGLTVTIFVSDEKTEKLSMILPNENQLDIQFLTDTDKEYMIEVTYLYKAGNYKDGESYTIDEIHNSANSSIKIVKNYIENEKINKKVSFSLETDGTKNANSLSNEAVITISTNSSETKIVVENKTKFLSNSLLLDKLTDDNSVFLDDMELEIIEATIQEIKDKVDWVLEDKKSNMNLIDLNSKTSIVTSNLNNMTTSNYLLIRNTLQNKIEELRNLAMENEEEFTLQNLRDLQIEGYDITTNVENERAVIVIDVHTFTIDSDFNIIDS